MEPSLPHPDSDLPRECYAIIDTPSMKRKRFPENCVTVMASEKESRAGADPTNNILSAVVFGPSRSSEGFRLFYLVRWLETGKE